MRVDVIARKWGSPAGGPNGMAIAAAFLACTLSELGHEVRQLEEVDGFGADLVITTVSQTWRRTAAAAALAGASSRVVYWHHAGGVPDGHGCLLATPPAVAAQAGWSRQVVLPPSSWAAEEGGERTGGEVVVAGASPAKGGHIARQVARLCPELNWLVLQGRSSAMDRAAWGGIPRAQVMREILPPSQILARARAVLSPTRFEVHPLLLVEAAVRGIPIVTTDMHATRCATDGLATYVPMNASAEQWASALREAIELPVQRLKLPPYADVVHGALVKLREAA